MSRRYCGTGSSPMWMESSKVAASGRVANRERQGATISSVVVFERSEAKQDRKERAYPHPDAGRWRVHDGPGCEEYDVAVSQIEGNVWANSSDAAPRGFGRGEAGKEEVGPVVRKDLKPLTQRRSGQEQEWKAISQDDRPTSGILSLEGDAVVNIKEQVRPSESN